MNCHLHDGSHTGLRRFVFDTTHVELAELVSE